VNQPTSIPDRVVKDHRQPGPPESVALRGAATDSHKLDVLAGRLYGGESE
jgi:hypothetical protein